MITLALSQLLYFIYLQTPFTHGEDGIQGIPQGHLFGIFNLANPTALYYVILAGFLFGFLYLKGESLLENRGRSTREERSEARVLVHPSAEVARHREEPPARRDHDDATQREIDRVLDKISAKGIASLTAEERRFLSDQGRSRKKD